MSRNEIKDSLIAIACIISLFALLGLFVYLDWLSVNAFCLCCFGFQVYMEIGRYLWDKKFDHRFENHYRKTVLGWPAVVGILLVEKFRK